MKKILYVLFVSAIVLVSCGKVDPTPSKDGINGQWELVGMSTKSVQIGEEAVTVYLQFADGRFDIYQQLGQGRFRHFDGTYTVTNGVLNGKYSDNRKLGSDYSVRVESDNLTLTSTSTGEVDTYHRCSIPANVIASAF